MSKCNILQIMHMWYRKSFFQTIKMKNAVKHIDGDLKALIIALIKKVMNYMEL